MIPPALEQPSPGATTTEVHAQPSLCSTREAAAPRRPHAPKPEKSQSAATGPSAATVYK